MKKTLGVVAAAAMAAMPVVGVFADTATQVDNINININSHCSIGYREPAEGTAVIDITGVEHPTGTWSDDTVSVSMNNSTVNNSFGTTKLGIYCNDNEGYTITSSAATDGSLTLKSGDDTIPLEASFSTTVSGWAYKTDNNGGGEGAKAANTWLEEAGIIVKKTAKTADGGDFYTITYGAGIDKIQASGTYTGAIKYTLASLKPSV